MLFLVLAVGGFALAGYDKSTNPSGMLMTLVASQ